MGRNVARIYEKWKSRSIWGNAQRTFVSTFPCSRYATQIASRSTGLRKYRLEWEKDRKGRGKMYSMVLNNELFCNSELLNCSFPVNQQRNRTCHHCCSSSDTLFSDGTHFFPPLFCCIFRTALLFVAQLREVCS